MLLNFLVTTLPGSMPNRSQSLRVRSGWDEPENTFMLGILRGLISSRGFVIPDPESDFHS